MPGEILSIRMIAEEFSTSTMPIREATARLMSEKALESLPNRGLRVPTLTKSRVKEIFKVRIVLETYACELAASSITDVELEELAAIENKLEHALEANDVHLALQLNTQFHFLIYNAARCETLIPLIESLWLQYAPTLHTLMNSVGEKDERRTFVQSHHSAVFDALKQRSPEKARKAMFADLDSTSNLEEFWSSLTET